RASSSSGSCRSTGLEPSNLRRCFRGLAPLRQTLAHPRHEPAHAQEVVHERWKCLVAILVAAREVADDAFLEVDLELVAFLHGFSRLRRLQYGSARVDSVEVEC